MQIQTQNNTSLIPDEMRKAIENAKNHIDALDAEAARLDKMAKSAKREYNQTHTDKVYLEGQVTKLEERKKTNEATIIKQVTTIEENALVIKGQNAKLNSIRDEAKRIQEESDAKIAELAKREEELAKMEKEVLQKKNSLIEIENELRTRIGKIKDAIA